MATKTLVLDISVPINGERDMMVIAEARNAAQALEHYRHHQPDVVTMDCMMTEKSGIEATREIVAEFPEAGILMLSGLEGEEDIFRAVDAGACGYLTKAAERDVVLSAIRQVDAERAVFPAAVAAKLAARMQREPLTEREWLGGAWPHENRRNLWIAGRRTENRRSGRLGVWIAP